MASRTLLLLLALCALVLPQDDDTGGRDTGLGRTILFVRWERTVETRHVYRAAWRALEPHLVEEFSRQRLVAFDGDADAARAYFAAHPTAALVVALDARSAAAARDAYPGRPVLEVGTGPDAHVSTRVDRERFAALLRTFEPDAELVAVLGGRDDALPGYRTKPCATPADAANCDAAWLPEGVRLPQDTARASLPPLIATAAHDDTGAIVVVRPDPVSAGLQAAALTLRRLRDDVPFARTGVARLRVTVDLDRARRAGFEVPLVMLARADEIRRAP